MTKCLMSICIPAHEKAAPLQRLLESIGKQSFTGFEVIITDDSKTEALEKIAALFKDHFPLRYYRNNPPAGMGNNWNASIEKATAPWIKIMHDDDWFVHSNALEKFADAARSANAAFIFSGACHVAADNNTSREYKLTGKNKQMLDESPFCLLYNNVIGHPSVTMFRKEDALIFDKQFKWVIDVDFYIRYLQQHDNRYGYIDETLINITNDDNQVSAGCYKNPLVEIPEYLVLLSKFSPVLHLQNKYAFYCLWELVRKFSVNNLSDIARFGFSGTLPEKLDAIISCQKKIPRILIKQSPLNRWLMKQCFNTLKK
ncbi:MAG: glycosyltransferase family 2 protein [Ferruginibacter sp.]